MHYKAISILLFFSLFVCGNTLFAQQKDSLRDVLKKTSLFPDKNKKDSVHILQDSFSKKQIVTEVDTIAQNAKKPKRDTFFLFKKQHTPKGATLRSLILPGWGQAYNHEYWKVPLAVAAVGIPLYLYFDNTAEYHHAQAAYHAVYLSLPSGQYAGATGEGPDFSHIEKKFVDVYNQYQSYYPGDDGKLRFLSSIQSYRNSFRQYRDYSILFTVLLWGLQVADATVFGHLREFDVSPDISMKVSPAYFQYTKVPGVTLTFNWKSGK
ncbi:MAG: DUF5683 domain-containing protein [Arachidicoccus sp.]|nr:DUF5683 domain-containing protein [Arachidicoccus sp.]